jgi:hypothetical protein
MPSRHLYEASELRAMRNVPIIQGGTKKEQQITKVLVVGQIDGLNFDCQRCKQERANCHTKSLPTKTLISCSVKATGEKATQFIFFACSSSNSL